MTNDSGEGGCDLVVKTDHAAARSPGWVAFSELRDDPAPLGTAQCVHTPLHALPTDSWSEQPRCVLCLLLAEMPERFGRDAVHRTLQPHPLPRRSLPRGAPPAPEPPRYSPDQSSNWLVNGLHCRIC